MRHNFTWPRRVLLLTGVAALAFLPTALQAAGPGAQIGSTRSLSVGAVNPNKQGDGTMSLAARRALTLGPRPAAAADVAAKAAANRAHDEAARAGKLAPMTDADRTAVGGTASGPAAPVIVNSRSFAGQFDANSAPSDSTGAVGTTRYVQLVNRRFAIYSKTSNTPLSSGSLHTLAGVSTSVNVFDPQVIWDPTTNRFYYAMDGIFSATDNELLYGFSKTASPSSAADWCKYAIAYGAEFPDFPKLGDTQHFAVIGANIYDSSDFYQRSDAVALVKPPAGTTCPTSVSGIIRFGLLDANNRLIFSPTPGNQIDTSSTGYIVARNLAVPSNQLWIFQVSRDATGSPVIAGTGKGVTLPLSYSIPPDATQSGLSQKLDTSDTRMTQAVLARNPRRSNAFSLWTQQTVANGTISAVRWYEINPVGSPPTLRTSGTIASSGNFLYNAAISSDRRVDGTTTAFGGSFVVGYNVSSAANNIRPRIVMASSVSGGAVSFALVRDAVGPYRDFTCATTGSTCRWGDYAGATPDPRPTTTGVGMVWLTDQFAGSTSTSTSQSNWRTRIWAARP